MPRLIIDGLEIDVKEGTKVIKAAELLGIMIPRFCYHEALGSVGACRMCAVGFIEGPARGVQMSCMVDAQDGMVVSTTDEEAVDFRRHVIEWLMMNHPHDCPVCDEGGHCLLQDETVSGGHGIRRYLGKKRTYHDQYLGVLVQHEMNRCIHCYRCSRFYQEFAGYSDYGVMRIANSTYFGRQSDGQLESPFSGNIIDLCPTGVLTDKPSRFKGRRWDFERTPSLCIHCSLGCSVVASARYREIVRLEARVNEAVNGSFICDRGRYGFYYANLPERPRQARVDKETVPLSQAIKITAQRLGHIYEKHGPGTIACLGSTRNSVETQGILKNLTTREGLHDPAYFLDPVLEHKVKRSVSRLDARLAVSLRDIEQSDCILVVGTDPLSEAPMLALAIRQANRNGAGVIVIDPRSLDLPFEYSHLPVAPAHADLCLSVLVKGAVTRPAAAILGDAALSFFDAIPDEYNFDPLLKDRVKELVPRLEESKNPVIVCGTDIVRETTPSLAADNALLLKVAKGRAGLFYVLPGPNAFCAALLSSDAGSQNNLLEAIESGAIKALLLVEQDPFALYHDQLRIEHAFERLELLVALDYVPSKAMKQAHIFLPTLTLFETRASFVNHEGRLQHATPVHHAGITIEQASAGQHPPRLFGSDVPGAEARAAWEVLEEIATVMSPRAQHISYNELWSWIAEYHPIFSKGMSSSEPAPGGVRLLPSQNESQCFLFNGSSWTKTGQGADGVFELLLVEWVFGTEELSQYSPYLQKVEPEPCMFMHPEDASRLRLTEGAVVVIDLERGSLKAVLHVAEHMARGVIVMPRHLTWQRIETTPAMVPAEKIRGA